MTLYNLGMDGCVSATAGQHGNWDVSGVQMERPPLCYVTIPSSHPNGSH